MNWYSYSEGHLTPLSKESEAVTMVPDAVLHYHGIKYHVVHFEDFIAIQPQTFSLRNGDDMRDIGYNMQTLYHSRKSAEERDELYMCTLMLSIKQLKLIRNWASFPLGNTLAHHPTLPKELRTRLEMLVEQAEMAIKRLEVSGGKLK